MNYSYASLQIYFSGSCRVNWVVQGITQQRLYMPKNHEHGDVLNFSTMEQKGKKQRQHGRRGRGSSNISTGKPYKNNNHTVLSSQNWLRRLYNQNNQQDFTWLKHTTKESSHFLQEIHRTFGARQQWNHNWICCKSTLVIKFLICTTCNMMII